MIYYNVITPFVPERTFTYQSDIKISPGSLVVIPFGNRKLRGVVISENTQPPEHIKYKKLEILSHDIPPMKQVFMDFIRKTSQYYFTPEGLFYKIAFPPNLLKGLNTLYHLKSTVVETDLAENELLIVSALGSGPRSHKVLSKTFSHFNLNTVLKRMINRGIVEKSFENPENIVQSVKRKAVALCHDVTDEEIERIGKRSPKQAEILKYLMKNRHNLFFLCAELSSRFNTSYSVFEALGVKGLVSVFYDFKSLVKEDRGFFNAISLSKHQQIFVDAFKNDPEGIKLLYGVTGSGKTECYLRCADIIMSEGKSVLFLVPEIGLTPSMISKLKIRFGSDIAIQHSSLSPGERMSEWLRILNRKVKIVVGTRSSVFAPMDNLGLIIVDEENDSSYKQETFPKYNGLHTALLRASLEKCPVILGSATPSIESNNHARNGKYSFFSLPERINNIKLPAITFVDMKEEFKKNKGKKVVLSELLQAEITRTLKNKKQTLLFLNRRGYAPFMLCRKCGFTILCENCSVTMTVHTGSGQLPLKCHYCGDEKELPHICPNCGDSFIQMIGFGTQRIEQKVKALFPEASVFRADRDTMQGKNAFTHLTEKMNSHDIDILIGTQMIAKGHHFPHLSLVGVIDADTGLKFPDFRSTEKTFAQLSQVAGRAGREGSPGKVIIQTYLADHNVFSFVKENSYEKMADRELQFRKHSGYPPESHIISLEIKGKDEDQVQLIASMIHEQLGKFQNPAVVVLGPLKAGMYKIKEYYRMMIVLKGENRKDVRKLFSQGAYPFYMKYLKDKHIKIIPDIDPVNVF